MLICHEHRFIFIKTRKTAGTSVEISLSRYLGPFGVITPITPRDEMLRAQMGILPRNYLLAEHPEPSVPVNESGVVQMLGTVEIQRRFYNHCPAERIRAEVGDRIWSSYTKFCFERNPWERVISEYHFQRKAQPAAYSEISLEEFIERELYSLNYPLYTVENRLAVDWLGRYEQLLPDLQQLCRQLGVPFDGWLPRAKGNFRPQRANAAEQLTPRLINLIGDRCRPEVELLQYDPPCARAA